MNRQRSTESEEWHRGLGSAGDGLRRRASSTACAWISGASAPSTMTSTGVLRGAVTRTPSMVSTSRAESRARCSRQADRLLDVSATSNEKGARDGQAIDVLGGAKTWREWHAPARAVYVPWRQVDWPRCRSRGSQTIAAINATAINVAVRGRNRPAPRSRPTTLFGAGERRSDAGAGYVRMATLYDGADVSPVSIRCWGPASGRVIDGGGAGEGGTRVLS
jgi:hypothetical protein